MRHKRIGRFQTDFELCGGAGMLPQASSMAGMSVSEANPAADGGQEGTGAVGRGRGGAKAADLNGEIRATEFVFCELKA